MSVDNTSDHVPIQVDINLPFISVLPLGGEVQQFINIMKIKWNNCSSTEIDEKCVSPLIADLNVLDFSDSTSTEELIKTLTEAIICHSTSLAPPPKRTNNKSKKSYFKLPEHVKMARANHSTAFEAWKSSDFVNTGEIFYNCKSTRAVYCSELQNFLNEKEHDKIKRLCDASETNEKLFWKLVKPQCSSSQMSAFLVDGKIITDKTDILNMWADHFETLGTPSDNVTYDKSFFQKVSCRVKEIFSIFSGNFEGILNQKLSYEIVCNICDKLKQGVTGIPFLMSILLLLDMIYGFTFISYTKRIFPNAGVAP